MAMNEIEQAYMVLKDQYAELARVIGSPADAWFGDPLENHTAIIERAKATILVRDVTRATDELLSQSSKFGTFF
jgi:hypothetical protein